MAFQSRCSRIKSMSHNSSSVYWPTNDTFSNVTNTVRPISRQSVERASRQYIDPWDLENYAYIQSLDEPEETSIPINEDLSIPYGASIAEDCPCYAGLDEQLFYNAKYEMASEEGAFNTLTDVDENSTNSGSALSTLRLHQNPEINFPPPPLQPSSAYEYYANVHPTNEVLHYPSNELIYESLPIDYPQYGHEDPYYYQYRDRGRRSSRAVNDPCYECLELQNMPVYYAPSNLRESYDTLYGPVDQRQRLERFGLSKKGLLQIDYSLSWMNLQRLIANK